MTTLTVKKDFEKNMKTEFETARELFIYLREKLTPISIFLVEDDTIPKSIRASIEKSEQEGENDLIDFKG
ncbi:MAG: hypothetical protein L3J41_13775 [Melioribacteraceae bacterium]|nr:hypothetical protein [Melioribacteraceae bacterium]